MHISTVTPHYMRLHDMLRETENEINKAIPAVKASDLKQKNRMATDWEKVSTNVGILVDLSQQTELDFGYLVERFAHIWEDAMCATEKINTPMYLRIYRLSGICTVGGAATRIWHRYLWSPIVFSTCTVAHVIVWETSYCTVRLDQLTSSSFCVYWLDWVPGLGPYIQETLIHRERAFKNLVIFLAGMSKDMASLYNDSKDGVRITKQGEELLRHIGEVSRKNAEQVTIEANIMSRWEKEQGSINIALSTFWSWFGYSEARENLTEKRARLMRQQELLIEVQQPYQIASGHFVKTKAILSTWSMDLQRIIRELNKYHDLIQRGDEGVWKSGMDWGTLRTSILELEYLLKLFRDVEERRKAQVANDAALVKEERKRCSEKEKKGGSYLQCMNEKLLR